jgi:hypothetical protein
VVSVREQVVTDTQVVTETHVVTDDGDHDRFTHIVLEGYLPEKGEFVALNNSVVAGMVNATPVRALCGKVWVPSRDPSRYPICPTCKELAEKLGWAPPAS